MTNHTSMMLDMVISADSPLIIAVSGGIDSVTLLHMLVKKNEPLIVAHVNHGIRSDSDEDEAFVRELATRYKLPFVATRLKLGSSASEDLARQARYTWLEKVAADHASSVIVTAHHQDDVLETIMINLIRGTGWRGLCSLRSTTRRVRPLLFMSKTEIAEYAINNELDWHEDSTNEGFRYLRNRVRQQLIPKMSSSERQNLLRLYDAQCALRNTIESESKHLVSTIVRDRAVARHPLIMIEPNVAVELLRLWLGESLEATRLSDLLLFAKVAQTGDKWSIDRKRYVVADKTRLIVLSPSD